MADNTAEALVQDGAAVKTADVAVKDVPSIEASLNKLVKVGGFDMLEATIEGVQNLNPERKARKKIFLTEGGKKTERKDLKDKLQLWIDLLTANNSISDMADFCATKAQTTEENLKQNLNKVLEVDPRT